MDRCFGHEFVHSSAETVWAWHQLSVTGACPSRRENWGDAFYKLVGDLGAKACARHGWRGGFKVWLAGQIDGVDCCARGGSTSSWSRRRAQGVSKLPDGQA